MGDIKVFYQGYYYSFAAVVAIVGIVLSALGMTNAYTPLENF